MRPIPRILAVALPLGLAASAPALPPDVPAQIHYQGVLLDDLGAPRTGTADLTVRIFDTIAGGTLLYKQEFPSTLLADGTFTLAIGPSGETTDTPTDPLTPDLATVFSGDLLAAPDRFLELAVDVDPALVRIQILTAPFALRADSAGQADNATSADVAQEVILVNGVSAQVLSEIFEHVNFDGGPPSDDPSEGLGDTDGDGIANFVDPDNDDDGINDTNEGIQGSDINLVTPVLTSVNPSSALFAFPVVLTVLGSNFEPGMSVAFGSENPTPLNLTPTSFDVVVGPQSIGTANVQVTRSNGETAAKTTLFSFSDFPASQLVSHGVSPPRLSTFDVRGVQQTLIGRSQKVYEVDTSPSNGDGIPDLAGNTNFFGMADYVFDATGQIFGIGCRRLVATTCSIRVVRDVDGDDFTDVDDPAEFTDVESFSGTIQATLSSASLDLDATGEVVAAYVRGIFAPTFVTEVAVAHDRNGDADYTGTNEVVTLETGLANAIVEVASDSAGNPAVVYLRNPGAPGELRLARDLTGDGDFDDSVGGNPEQQTLVSGDAECFGATFDGSDRLAIVYQESGAGSAMLLHDLDSDGDFAGPGESTALAGSGVTACAISTTPVGGLAVAYNADSDLTLLQDRNADGDFDDSSEIVPLGTTTTDVNVASSTIGVFVVTDDEVFLNPVAP